MAGISVSVLKNRCDEVSATLVREARAYQVQRTERLRQRAQMEAPVRSGFLRDHIVTDAARATGTRPEGFRSIAVVSQAPYSDFVHNGTRYQAPNPFLMRAAEAERDSYVSGFSAVGAAL